MTKDQIIDELDLSPHPEGGYYKEVYRSEQDVTADNGNSYSAGTGIYFLLPEGVCTSWHCVSSDELWHFYYGDKLVLEVIDEERQFQQLELSNDFGGISDFNQLVPQNCWQRAYSTGRYSLAGCTVCPGFEFEDFEIIGSEQLAAEFPSLVNRIINDPFER